MYIYINIYVYIYIDMYIDFFLVFALSHMKCKQHKVSHNIIIAGPGPMRPRGPSGCVLQAKTKLKNRSRGLRESEKVKK